MTTTEKEQKIKKYLEQGDTEQTKDLDLCIMNDYKYYSICKKLFDSQYQKRFVQDNFNYYLFLQIFKNAIDYILNDKQFTRYYTYSKKNTNVATRYTTAQKIVDYFIENE